MNERYRHDGTCMPVVADAMVVAKRRDGSVTGSSARDGIASAPVKADHLALSWRWEPDSDHPLDVVVWRGARPIGEIIQPIMADIAKRVEDAA